MVFILSSSTSSEAGLLNQQSKQRCPDFFTSVSPLECVQDYLKQVPEPPQLTPFNVKELHRLSCFLFPSLVNKPQATWTLLLKSGPLHQPEERKPHWSRTIALNLEVSILIPAILHLAVYCLSACWRSWLDEANRITLADRGIDENCGFQTGVPPAVVPESRAHWK